MTTVSDLIPIGDDVDAEPNMGEWHRSGRPPKFFIEKKARVVRQPVIPAKTPEEQEEADRISLELEKFL